MTMKALEIVERTAEEEEFVTGLLRGYRFRLCRDAADVRAALGIRREVYVDGNGYDVPIPDSYDLRSWHVLAEDTERGIPCGSLRITPRAAGSLEAEEYLDLPPALRRPGTLELSRFAILPPYRKGKTFLPIVSLGLFAVVRQLLDVVDASYMAICCKPERIWTFEWLLFERTGLRARYEKLDGSEHELLFCDVHRNRPEVRQHPFHHFLDVPRFPQVEPPDPLPPLGLFDAFDPPAESLGGGDLHRAVA